MKLNIKNPIIFFDLETTGINVAKDRIVEIGYIKVYPNGKEESNTLLINPTIPMPEEAQSIHGISDEDVKDKPTFKEIAKQLVKDFEGCDLGGFNSNKFDIPLLVEEFLRADIDFDVKKRNFIDVQVIFHKMEKRTLGAAYKFYCGETIKNAHSALADTKATYEVLKAQIERYESDDYIDNKGEAHKVNWTEVASLADFSSQNKNVDFVGRIILNEKGEEVFNFGKHKGKPVIDVLQKEPSYFNWILNGDFPRYTKKVLTNIKLRSFQK